MRTDHGALKYLFNFIDPQGQMVRWLQVLETYTFEIEHRAGKRHGIPDAMSRGLWKQCGDAECPVHVITRAHTERQIKARDAAGGQEDVGR